VDWDWPDELDALVAAPAHHSLLVENERVRVLETLIPPGETTAVHTHCWPNVQHVLSSTDFIRRDGEGVVLLDTRAVSGHAEPTRRTGPTRCPHIRSRTSASATCA
jgi:hypothetical protein